MKRALALALVVACGHDAPPRTEVSIAAPTSSAPAEMTIALDPADAGVRDEDLVTQMMNDGKPPENAEEAELMRVMLGGDAGKPQTGAPVVHVSTSTTMVGLPREVIRRVVRARYAAMRACYESALAKQPGLKGRVNVRFTIDPRGAVTKAERDPASTMANDEVVSCVVGAFKTMQFPEPEGGSLHVMYPIVFDTGE